MIAGTLFVLVVGVVMERVIIRHFYGRPHEDQLLVTFGLGIVLRRAGALLLRQPLARPCRRRRWAAGITSLGFMIYPTYRLVVVGIVAVALLALCTSCSTGRGSA